MPQPNVQELTHVIDEVRQRIGELERLLRDERLRFESLVSQLLPLLFSLHPSSGQDVLDVSGDDLPTGETFFDHELPTGRRLTRKGKVDGRSRFDPEKYMKITVKRTLEWAKRYRQSVEVAQVRVNAKVQERAEHYGLKAVPKSVKSYIESAVREY